MHSTRSLSYAALLTATCGWSLSPVFIRLLSGAYDPFTQALIRYLGALAPLLVYSMVAYRADLLRALRRPGATLGLALANATMQTAWTVAIYHTTATTAQLMSKLQIPFIIIFSYLLFKEERTVIRNPLFLVGALLGLIGVSAVLMDDPSAPLIPQVNFAVLLLLYVSVSWSVYAVWGKHAVADIHPVPMFTVVAAYTVVYFAALSLIVGRPGALLSAGAGVNGLALLSGTVPIAAAHCTFLYAQKHLGAAFCASIIMLNPLLTHVLALFLWPDERMIWIQWAGAALLIGGSFMVIHAERRATAAALAAGAHGPAQ